MMNDKMLNYWEVTTQFEIENERGRIQKVRENYLVRAFTGTEAEAKVYQYLESQKESDFTITKLAQSRILLVIEDEQN